MITFYEIAEALKEGGLRKLISMIPILIDEESSVDRLQEIRNRIDERLADEVKTVKYQEGDTEMEQITD